MLAAMLLAGCSCGGQRRDEIIADDSTAVLINSIRQQNRLYSTEYKVRKIVTHEDMLSFGGTLFSKTFSIALPFGKRKIAIPIDATLRGSVDFSKTDAGSVRLKDGKMEIILPDPQITLISTRIDYTQLRQHVALLRSRFTDEELTHYAQIGRKQMLRDMKAADIVERTRVSAARIIVPMLVRMGYSEENITVTYRKDFDPKSVEVLNTSPQPGR